LLNPFRAFAVPYKPRIAAIGGPTPVAIHDNGDMLCARRGFWISCIA
jgi:hypothetical protein